jgi:hypothetical protein
VLRVDIDVYIIGLCDSGSPIGRATAREALCQGVQQAVVGLSELKVEHHQVNVYCLMTAGTAPRKIGIYVVLSASSDRDEVVKNRLCQQVGEVVDDYLTLHQADAGTIEGIIVTTKTIDPSREGSAQLERAFL